MVPQVILMKTLLKPDVPWASPVGLGIGLTS